MKEEKWRANIRRHDDWAKEFLETALDSRKVYDLEKRNEIIKDSMLYLGSDRSLIKEEPYSCEVRFRKPGNEEEFLTPFQIVDHFNK